MVVLCTRVGHQTSMAEVGVCPRLLLSGRLFTSREEILVGRIVVYVLRLQWMVITGHVTGRSHGLCLTALPTGRQTDR